MAPADIAVSTAVTFIETVVIIIPIWLAGIRYFLDDAETDKDTGNLFAGAIIMIYVSLATVLVSSGVIIIDLENQQLSSAIFGLWLLFFTTGSITFYFLNKQTLGDVARGFLWMGMAIGVVFSVASFFLLIATGYSFL